MEDTTVSVILGLSWRLMVSHAQVITWELTVHQNHTFNNELAKVKAQIDGLMLIPFIFL